MMRSVVLFIVLALCFGWGTAWSQPGIAPPFPDRLGVYTTADCANNNEGFYGVDIYRVYCVLTGTTRSAVRAFEFFLRYEPQHGLVNVGYYFPDPAAIIVSTFPDFVVGFSTPIPPGVYSEVVLVTIDFFLFDPTPVYFYVEPTHLPQSIPGSMAYYDEANFPVPMYPVSGDFAFPVFGFNTGPIQYFESAEIIIDAEPQYLNAPWALSGPDGYEYIGMGDLTLPELVYGSYSLQWDEVPEWSAPVPDLVEFDLVPGDSYTVSGTYRALPQIQSVADVPNDQGRQARISWQRCPHDAAGMAYSITEYGVYRQQPAKSLEKLGGWDFIGSVPARGDLEYQLVAPTLCDSTIADGLCETTFMVSAMTADPLVYFDSESGVGYSVDNLRPITPAGLKVDFSASQNVLTWNAPADTDVDHYLVYRTDSPGNPPDPADTPLAQVHDTAYTDNGAGWGLVYWVAAVDHSGNRSDLTDWSEAELSGVGDGTLPKRAALYSAAPNPFNPATTISFDLPRDQHARLTVYGIDGRLVTELVNEVRTAGTNRCLWQGTDDSGRRVASGTYVYRLETEGFTDSKRIVLLK